MLHLPLLPVNDLLHLSSSSFSPSLPPFLCSYYARNPIENCKNDDDDDGIKKCGVCGKRFTASSNLYYHRMTHNKVRNHHLLPLLSSFIHPSSSSLIHLLFHPHYSCPVHSSLKMRSKLKWMTSCNDLTVSCKLALAFMHHSVSGCVINVAA